MHKYVKAGLLIITLVFPVLIYIFLKVFTTNHYDLPYYVPLRNSLSGEIVKAGKDTLFYQIDDFSLTSTDRKKISNATITGKTTVLSLLKSPCADSCQKILANLTRLSDLSAQYPQFTMLTLVNSGDPNIVAQIEKARRQNPGWNLVIAADSVLTLLLVKTFHLSENGVHDQTFSPYGRFSLIDSKGYIRGYYDALEPEEMERLFAEIKILEYNRKEAE